MAFSSDKHRMYWIAAHFVATSNDISPAQSWFLSLLMKNAHIHGITDPYTNLKSLEYIIPPLLTTDAFIQELIYVFGDKMSSKTAREALSRCKRGNSSIVDYNTLFTSLAFHVIQSEGDLILKYVAGLQYDIHMAAIHLAGWTESFILVEKQNLAIWGAQIVDEIASVKGQARKHTIYQHPNGPKPNPIPIHIKPSLSTSTNPVPMDINSVTTKDDRRNPFPAIQSVCIKEGLCFRCLKKYNTKTHIVNGEHHFPNKNTSFSDKMSLLSSKKQMAAFPHQIAAVSITNDTDKQDLVALEELNDEEAEVVRWTIEGYMEGLSDVDYPPSSDIIHQTQVNIVELVADPSSFKRVYVPLTLKQDMIRVPIMGFFDTGSMTNLIDEKFAQKHHLKLQKKKFPLKKSAFNGLAGDDIWWEWAHEIDAVGLDGKVEVDGICLNITKLSGHEVILGYPWMGEVGCKIVIKGTRLYVTLGHMLIVAMTKQTLPTVDCESQP